MEVDVGVQVCRDETLDPCGSNSDRMGMDWFSRKDNSCSARFGLRLGAESQEKHVCAVVFDPMEEQLLVKTSRQMSKPQKHHLLRPLIKIPRH